MTFLPIVERELRVRSRQVWTYTWRCLAAGIALVVTAGLLSMLLSRGGRGAVGQPLFYGLTVLAFIGCVLEGARTSADALSQERREGTLGLLFLTRLRSYDVVLGKLAAASLHAFYGLAAMVPVLALCLLGGGVTGGEVGRVSLALLNTVFFTLAVGLWVSARSEDEQRALFGTLGLVVAASVLPPLLDWGVLFLGEGFFFVASPAAGGFLAMEDLYRARPWAFWMSLSVVHGMGWYLLFRAGCYLRAVIRVKDTFRFAEPATGEEERAEAAIFQSSKVRDRSWLETKPVLWLWVRNRPLVGWVWALLILSLFSGFWLQLVVTLATPAQAVPAIFFAGSYLNVVVLFALRLVLAAMACRFFVEARRGGFLELLVTSPVSRQEILGSQWEGLRRFWLRPVMAVVLLHGVFYLALFLSREGRALPGLSGYYWISFSSQVLTALGDFYAVGWVGMWLAYANRKPGLAAMQTFGCVIVLPWLFCSGFWAGNILSYRLGGIGMGLGAFPPLVVTLLKDLFFILWARNRLRGVFLGEPSQFLREPIFRPRRSET